jgi:hypothetical protein
MELNDDCQYCFSVVRMDGKGNCMFASIAQQLGKNPWDMDVIVGHTLLGDSYDYGHMVVIETMVKQQLKANQQASTFNS